VSKKPSVETELKTVKRMLRDMTERETRAVNTCELYRQRATKAEQEAAEWRRRFDLLLARTPQLTGEAGK
jgi:hypothetical protein